jgi:GT2 family glycosyltransferase
MIGFVLLNYLAFSETINCVKEVLRLPGPKQIVIVDNYSYNESFDALMFAFGNKDNIKIIETGENLGFAKGNNIGYKYLLEHFSCDFIVVMNTDIEILQNDFIDRIYNAFNEKKFYVLGPDIFSTKTNRHQNPENLKNFTKKDLQKIKFGLIIKRIFFIGFFIKYMYLKVFNKKNISKKTNVQKEIDDSFKSKKTNVPLHGSFYVFSSLFISKENNCFYPETFMYFESYILHYLCMKKNYLMVYEPSIQVIHHEDVSTDMAYKKSYKKALFGNKCLLQSVKVYLNLLKRGN